MNRFMRGEHVYMYGATGGAFMACVHQADDRFVEVIFGTEHYQFMQGSGQEVRGPKWCHRFITPIADKEDIVPGTVPHISDAGVALHNLCNINFYTAGLDVETAQWVAKRLQGVVDTVSKARIEKALSKPKQVKPKRSLR